MEDDIKMDYQDLVRWVMNWIELAHGYRQVAGTCECDNKLSGSIKCWIFSTRCKPVSFSRRTAPLSKEVKYLF
jgi:hypothetical protein